MPELAFSKFRPLHSLCKGFLNAGKMPRRNRISLEHRERIVRGFEDEEEDYLVVADTLGVNRSTARGIACGALHQRGQDLGKTPRR